MFVAIDAQGNRVYADTIEKDCSCFCPVCNEQLRLRRGGINKPHFAHKQDTDCLYGKDKDYKSEWHIRMQGYFPKESCEVRFVDDETGEVHIADVFIEGTNTVLEFQHSPISETEFMSRTAFHIKNGRRIAWLFDESSSSLDSTFGRFRLDEDLSWYGVPFYQWMRNPRKFLAKGPDLKLGYNLYSIDVYTGTEGDAFHRIVAQRDSFHLVGLSLHKFEMKEGFDVDSLFSYDPFWAAEDRELARRQWLANQQKLAMEQRINNLLFQPRRTRRSRRF